MDRPKIYILHENKEWIQPLLRALQEMGLPHEEWFLDQGTVDLQQVPPEGVFYNRMSASSHTRGNRFAVELTAPVLAWLEQHDRTVVNDRRALQLEVRKFEQYLALQSHDIRTPHTIAAVGREEVLEAARGMKGDPFILKPNRGGKGAGVQLFDNITALETFLDTADPDFSLDGVFLIQEFIRPADGSIVRTEFIGGEFYYAVRVDASDGFSLCPADNCSPGDDFCPTSVKSSKERDKFSLIQEYENPDIPSYKRFLAENGMEIAAIEYVMDETGDRYVYDVNTNTNYNREAERRAGDRQKGMWEIARFLRDELNKQMNSQEVLHNNAPGQEKGDKAIL